MYTVSDNLDLVKFLESMSYAINFVHSCSNVCLFKDLIYL